MAQLVFEQAAAGDSLARGIIAIAAGELTTAVLTVAARLSFAGVMPLALTGGVLRNQPGLCTAVLRWVRRRRPVGPVIVVDAAQAAAQALAAEATLAQGWR